MGAFFLLQGVQPSDPTFNDMVKKPVLNVPIFTQVGSWECRFYISHNLCQYLVYIVGLKNQMIEEPKVGFQQQCYLCNTFKI
jgi:hypothetical protein